MWSTSKFYLGCDSFQKKQSCIWFFYPMSVACWTPARVVQFLPGAWYLFTLSSYQVFLAQPHLCLQATGGSHIPAQPCATLPHLRLHHRHRNVVLHSFQCIWEKNKQKTPLLSCEIIYHANVSYFQVGISKLPLPFWFLKGHDSRRIFFFCHRIWKNKRL